MTQAFRMLGDPRAYYVELPRYRKDPPGYKYVFRNNLRQAYLRHLVQQNPEKVHMEDFVSEQESIKRRYVALHHFHPAVVRAFYENPLTSAQKHKVPISITEHELEELGMDVFEEDRILSISGMPTGGYYFVPSYPHTKAHDDLKTLIQAMRTIRPRKQTPNSKTSDDKNNGSRRHERKAVPTDIEISQKSSPSNKKKKKLVQLVASEMPSPEPESTTTTVKSSVQLTNNEDPFEDESFKDNVFTSFNNDKAQQIQPSQSFEEHAFDAFKEDEKAENDIAFSDDVFASLNEKVVEVTVEVEASTVILERAASPEQEKAEANAEIPVRVVLPGQENRIDGEVPKRTVSPEQENDSNDDHDDKEENYNPFRETTDITDDGLTSSTDIFENLWEKDAGREIETSLVNETIFEEESEGDENDEDVLEPAFEDDSNVSPSKASTSLASRRSGDRNRPWETPKYRRDRIADEPMKVSGPAHYIDPTFSGDLTTKLSKSASMEDDGEDIAQIAADMTVFRPKEESGPKYTTPAISPSPSLDSHFSRPKDTASVNSTSPKPKRRFDFAEDDAFSIDSGDSGMSGAIFLNHQLPGADPTLRIQVHNDLIAWESKRRSDLAQQLEYNRQRWQAAADILSDGIAEAQYAERLILGISRASKLFADSLRAVYDDKLLDDRGNAVKNSFMQNRLAKQRSKFEYSIENEDSLQSKQSMLLDSIVEAQVAIADAFVSNTAHMEEEILPEIVDLTAETTRESRKLELLGESIIGELKRSEIEVKNIWGEFDR